MEFQPRQFMRTGVIYCQATIEEVFPLLCPKKEEDWIPGWECETIWSQSGYNEEGAIFRTTKAYDTELYWVTLQYDIKKKSSTFCSRHRACICSASKSRLTPTAMLRSH